uniref:hypothetical protein n=1 Tax=uncultured Psychrobacter sp. TaxID=259303 RepID=UPI002631CB4A|nr:hypothetical protein [uncultured Psychrobacter sp.]
MINLRKHIFWMKDKLFRDEIKDHYLDIKNNINGTISTTNINLLLKHVINNSRYYKNLSPNSKLEDFPVINKNIIKNNLNDLIADGHDIQHLHTMSTSGSTGTPFKSYQDKRKRNRVIAEIIYFNQLARQELGDKFIYFRVWNKHNNKSLASKVMQNIECIDILKLDDSVFSKTVKMIKKDRHLKSCLGYATTYEHLLRYMIRNSININPANLASVITSSEVMPLETKLKLKEKLNCEIYDRYSNQENGIIAQSKDCSDLFLVNYPSYIVEILKEDCDLQARDGEIGRIVITDLYNYAMPYIRYDTGDLAIKVGDDQFCKFIKAVQGRKVDVFYNTDGQILTPHSITNYMWEFDKLSQYQFIQESKTGYVLKVSGAENIYTEYDFIKVLRPILGENSSIKVEFVNTIPVLSSGKFKKNICLYDPTKE